MSPFDEHAPFAAGFMDDYFAEADEHLVAARQNLLALEPAVGGGVPPPAVLDELFRSFHSLKGISAMVELRAAELLAHQIESALRALRDGAALTGEAFETLLDGTKALEGVVVAHRTSAPAPDITAVGVRLDALARPSRADAAPATAAVGPAPAGSARVWRVVFVPSPPLVERGVKVETIRARLLQIGRVLQVVPRVHAGSGIAFEFDVQTDDEAQLAAWREDGVTYEALAAPTAAEAALAAGEPAGAEAVLGRRVSDIGTTPGHYVRVDLARLDDLMRLVGDMVVTRARLDDTLARVERHIPFQEWRGLQEHAAGLGRQLRDLREGVMRVRLVPVGEVFRRMPFVVRDLARDSGRRVQLELTGQATEIDKFLIERIMDPLLHLVRNAISHGIEPPAERLAAGKPESGRIRLGASTTGESVVIEVRDDGRGIDAAAVAARARARGLVALEGTPDEAALLDILCASGFSTRDEVDRASGRGVGMAVVRSAVHELGGTLGVSSTVGAGTTFTITLPLTLAITDAIIAQVGAQTFAVPQAAVREVVEVDPARLRALEGHELMPYRGGTLPMVRLARLFALPISARPRLHAVVVGTGLGAVGLIVDRIAGQREIVVKTIVDPLIRVDGVSGATELGDGRLVLILDVAALHRGLRERAPAIEGVSA